MLFESLREIGMSKATILLDEPISNSGRLKSLMAEIGENYPFSLDIQIQRDVDRTLYGKENIVTSDSIILDECSSWFNLTAKCLEKLGQHGLCVWERSLME